MSVRDGQRRRRLLLDDSKDNVPRCKAHAEKITRCDPCSKKLNAQWKVMPKVEPRGFTGMSGIEWNMAVDRAVEENQERLHSWAVANLYKNPNELGEEPF